MTKSRADLLQGSLDLLILKTLAHRATARMGGVEADPAAEPRARWRSIKDRSTRRSTVSAIAT